MPSPAVRAFLVTLSCEAGGHLPPYGMATLGFPNGVAVVPQWLVPSVLKSKKELLGD